MTFKKLFITLSILFATILWASPNVSAESFTPVDRPANSSVYDPNDYISQEAEDYINQANANHQEVQVGVVIVDRLTTNVEDEAIATARHWKVGYSDSNRGALIYIAIEDKKFRIETSDSLANSLTDYEASQILEAAKPFFREGKYSQGVQNMVDTILLEDGTTEVPIQEPVGNSESSLSTILLIIGYYGFVLLVSYSLYRLRQKKETLAEAKMKALRAQQASNINTKTNDKADILTTSMIASSISSSKKTSSPPTTPLYDSSTTNISSSDFGWSGGDFSGGGASGDW